MTLYLHLWLETRSEIDYLTYGSLTKAYKIRVCYKKDLYDTVTMIHPFQDAGTLILIFLTYISGFA